jgi:hypothetical protein
MKRLIVHLDYGTAGTMLREGPNSSLALPVKALDADGSVISDGAASANQAAELLVPDSMTVVFVRLTWPSGRAETRRVDLDVSGDANITFSDSEFSANEWSAWAVPKLNPRTPLANSDTLLDLGLNRFSRVWLRLWRFADGAWVLQKLQPSATHRNSAAWQLEFMLDPCPWLLQIGGSQVIWRFLSLPGGGPAKVLITPRDSSDPRADALKVVVTSAQPDAETLLEFLARDAMRAADTLANATHLAQRLFANKFNDPLTAVAGAYYLLRVNAWDRIPRSWAENLSQSFPWLPDAAIIHCTRLLREGNNAVNIKEAARNLFALCLARGWPVYAEGITLLQEAASLLREVIDQSDEPLLEKVRALGVAKAWAGAAASFYGRKPNNPSALHWVGMPNAPRRRRLHPELRRPKRLSSNNEVSGLDEVALEFAASGPAQIRAETASAKRHRAPTIESDEYLLGKIT